MASGSGVGILLLILGGLALSSRKRSDDTKGAAPAPKPTTGASQPVSAIWPIEESLIQSEGQSVMKDRDGKGTPHNGIDIYAPTGTRVRSATDGKVIRVVDGRGSSDEGKWKAGLWVDIRDSAGHVHRYLHLHEAYVKYGDSVKQGHTIGTVTKEGVKELRNTKPHLHYEIRETDWLNLIKAYGKPIDPKTQLPQRAGT